MQPFKRNLLPALLFLVAAAAAASCLSALGRSPGALDPNEASAAIEPGSLDGEPISPLPLTISLDARKVKLGRRLFSDKRLSADNTISCASCHDLTRNGADNHVKSAGIGGRLGDVNTPTVFNSGLNFRQFWDGRAESLEAQIEGPIHDPNELGTDWPEILEKLRADSEYTADFFSIYSRAMDRDAIKDAIATFTRSLITPDSRFDRYLRGNHDALSADEIEGYRLFNESGCSSCHQGALVGGNMFEKLGIVRDYFADRGHISKADLGRFNTTGDEQDRYEFKVPSLRNVARTAPYFHDGSARTLEDAVKIMAKYQLGRELSDSEVHRIVQFLESLNGTLPGEGQ
jgi:cytochrome c peroxidase